MFASKTRTEILLKSMIKGFQSGITLSGAAHTYS